MPEDLSEPSQPKPLTVVWPEDQRERVTAALCQSELPPAPEGSGWTYGCDRDYLAELREYWLERFDWDAAVARLNAYPQYVVDIDGLDIHYVHVRGEGPNPRPLLLTHGWPGSHLEFWDLIGPLTRPSEHGGRTEDAFDLVIPSLPGYALSGKPKQPIGQRATAAMWNTLMTRVLSYPRYLAQGGDWGGIVTSWIGLEHGDHAAGIHLNLTCFQPPLPLASEAEQAWGQAFGQAQARLGAYSALQRTKPQSLAWMAMNNPLGQAAWIIERFHDWSDLRQKSFEEVHNRDFLLTNALLYIMTDSFATAAWYYAGLVGDPGMILAPGRRCETPSAIAAFPGDSLLPFPPRERVEKAYNITRWTNFATGGHFAAAEEPELFSKDVMEWAREAW